MPTSSFNNVNLAASTKTANLLAGDINEFISYPAIIKLFCVSSAAGVRLSLFADSDILVDDKEIVNIGASIKKSDDLIDSFEIEEGSRLSLFLRETAASATTDVLTSVEVIPI